MPGFICDYGTIKDMSSRKEEEKRRHNYDNDSNIIYKFNFSNEHNAQYRRQDSIRRNLEMILEGLLMRQEERFLVINRQSMNIKSKLSRLAER